MGRKTGFCIFKKEIGGPVRVQRDPDGAPRIFPTRDLAEEEIAKSVVARIFQAFGGNAGETDGFGEAPSENLSVRDYVREVQLLEGGILQDPDGNQFQ